MGYVNAPQGRNPWISEPPMPQISHRQPFPSYHTSRGNMNRGWQGDAETNLGSRLGQIAYGQSMYVSEWIRPQIDANDTKARLKAAAAEQQTKDQVANQPPSVTQALSNNRKRTTINPNSTAPAQQDTPSEGDNFTAAPRRIVGGSVAAYKPGEGGRPAPWMEDSRVPETRGFGQRLTQSRLQHRSAPETGPSLLGALPAPAERVGPSAKRRGPAGMDLRRRGTWLGYE